VVQGVLCSSLTAIEAAAHDYYEPLREHPCWQNIHNAAGATAVVDTAWVDAILCLSTLSLQIHAVLHHMHHMPPVCHMPQTAPSHLHLCPTAATHAHTHPTHRTPLRGCITACCSSGAASSTLNILAPPSRPSGWKGQVVVVGGGDT
jgi:hypothetical protein